MKINADFETTIKLIIVGDTGVGKTNFIFQFTENKFSPIHVATVGIDSKTKIIKLPKYKINVKLQIWDTAGQERYMALNKHFFHKIQGIILMYDITNRSSFDNVSTWLEMIKETVSNKTVILVGNKCDLEELRIVSENEGKKIAKDNNIFFFEGSGRIGGEKLNIIFTTIAEEIYSNLINRNNSSNLELDKDHTKKKKCCGGK